MLKVDCLRATPLLSKYPATAFCLHAYIKTMLSGASIEQLQHLAAWRSTCIVEQLEQYA